MKDESPDEIGPDRTTVQPPKTAEPSRAKSKISADRLTTAGSKVTHAPSTVSEKRNVDTKRTKKVIRSAGTPSEKGSPSSESTGARASADKQGDDETWVASGVAAGWDGSNKKPGTNRTAGDKFTDDPDGQKQSLFARDDDRQRARKVEGSPHRGAEAATAGAIGANGTSSADRSADDREPGRSRTTDETNKADEEHDGTVTPLRSAIEWIVAIGLAILAALFIKTFLLQAFVIPSGSMLPALQDRDRVLVSKQTYRFVDIERGDVVVFDNPDWQPNEPEQLIKRVIGLPRDSVEAREGDLIVNGKILIEDYLDEGTITDDFPRTIVPDDAVFVMGDNRRNSKDSRVVGPILLEDFTGHAFIRIWPPSRIGGL